MSDETYREPFIKEEGRFESEKTVYHAAYEEVRQLADASLLDELYSLLEEQRDNTKRKDAYFIIGYIAKNTNNLPATNFLLESLKVEKDKFTLGVILDRLAELYKPVDLDLSPIYKLTKSRNSIVRGSAFEALTNTGYKVEDYLLEHLSEAQKKEDVRPLLSALFYVGSEKAIPLVEKQLKHRAPVIKSYAHNVLTVILIRRGLSKSEIAKRVKVSEAFVQHHFENMKEFTRPG